VYQQQEQQQEQQEQEQEQDAENPFLDPPFSRIKIIRTTQESANRDKQAATIICTRARCMHVLHIHTLWSTNVCNLPYGRIFSFI
jgi:hypothetical protein